MQRAAPIRNSITTSARPQNGVGRAVPARARAIGNQAALRTVRALSAPAIQRKLEVGRVDDPLERDADRVAEQVMRMADPAVSVARASAQVSRKCAACAEEEKLQKKPVGASGAAAPAPAIVHEVLRSPGAPLDAATRDFMEPRFAHDFGDVRIHADDRAAQSARAMDALAYAVGPHIVFGSGHYSPLSDTGRRL